MEDNEQCNISEEPLEKKTEPKKEEKEIESTVSVSLHLFAREEVTETLTTRKSAHAPKTEKAEIQTAIFSECSQFSCQLIWF